MLGGDYISNIIEFPEWNKKTTAQINTVLEMVNDFLDAHGYEYEYEVEKNVTFKKPQIAYKILFFDIMKSRGDYEIIRQLSSLISGVSIGTLTDGYTDVRIGINV